MQLVNNLLASVSIHLGMEVVKISRKAEIHNLFLGIKNMDSSIKVVQEHKIIVKALALKKILLVNYVNIGKKTLVIEVLLVSTNIIQPQA